MKDKYYNEIKNKLIDNEIYSKVKDYSKERHTLITHYEVGRLLYEAGSNYGEDIIGNYSKKLMLDVNKKYTSRTLRRMRQMYQFFEEQKWSPVGTKLSISHIRQLFSFDDNDKIKYYVKQVEKRNLSKRQLENIIKSKEYERLPEKAKNKIIKDSEIDIKDSIKEPILIRSSALIDEKNISEKILHKLILEDIDSFLNELGEGYSYIKSEYQIKIGDVYNYIDMLLFNIKYNCYVVVEFKVTELRSEHIGQVEKYVNYIDQNIKNVNHNKTIGIIIVREYNKFVIRYSTDNSIISRTYKIV